MPISTTAVTVAITTIFGGAAYAVAQYDPLRSLAFPASEGVIYLQQNGYSHVEHRGRDYSGICGKRNVARLYEADKKDGTHEKDIVVCFSRILWAYRPG